MVQLDIYDGHRVQTELGLNADSKEFVKFTEASLQWAELSEQIGKLGRETRECPNQTINENDGNEVPCYKCAVCHRNATIVDSLKELYHKRRLAGKRMRTWARRLG